MRCSRHGRGPAALEPLPYVDNSGHVPGGLRLPPWLLTLAIGLTLDDELVGRVLKTIDRALGEHRISHDVDPFSRLPVGGHDRRRHLVSLDRRSRRSAESRSGPAIAARRRRLSEDRPKQLSQFQRIGLWGRHILRVRSGTSRSDASTESFPCAPGGRGSARPGSRRAVASVKGRRRPPRSQRFCRRRSGR